MALLHAAPAKAAKCSAYEKNIAALADEAARFEKTEEFGEYGFGRGGPFYPWLDRFEAVALEADAEFMGKHGFVPEYVPQIALQYRSKGFLDPVLQSFEDQIVAFRKRC